MVKLKSSLRKLYRRHHDLVDISNTTGAHVKQDLLILPEHMRSFPVCVLYTIISLFVFFFFSHCVVSLFFFYEFECVCCIFRPSLLSCFSCKNVNTVLFHQCSLDQSLFYIKKKIEDGVEPLP